MSQYRTYLGENLLVRFRGQHQKEINLPKRGQERRIQPKEAHTMAGTNTLNPRNTMYRAYVGYLNTNTLDDPMTFDHLNTK